MSNVAVLGVGAIGGVFGVRLCRSGRHDVMFCVRKPIDKLVVETPDSVIESPVKCVTSPSEAGPVDCVLLAVKGHQIQDVTDWLEVLVGEDTIIAVLQNGVEHRERVEPYTRGAEVVPVVVNCPADRLAPGHVAQQGGAQLVPEDGPGARLLASLYEDTDVPVKPTSDFTTASWAKLCNNVGAGPATALTDKGRGVMLEPAVAELCRGLVRECAAVGRAEGAKLADDVAERTIERLRDADPEATTSMLVDRRAGRRVEADVMTGAVVRIGARHGIPTPLNGAVHALLSSINVPVEDKTY